MTRWLYHVLREEDTLSRKASRFYWGDVLIGTPLLVDLSRSTHYFDPQVLLQKELTSLLPPTTPYHTLSSQQVSHSSPLCLSTLPFHSFPSTVEKTPSWRMMPRLVPVTPSALRQPCAAIILTEPVHNSMRAIPNSKALMLVHLRPFPGSALPSERVALSWSKVVHAKLSKWALQRLANTDMLRSILSPSIFSPGKSWKISVHPLITWMSLMCLAKSTNLYVPLSATYTWYLFAYENPAGYLYWRIPFPDGGQRRN